jgi:hypothetical protein
LIGREYSDLISFSINPVKYGLVGGVAETSLDSRLFVILEPSAEALWAIVEGISEGLMDTF